MVCNLEGDFISEEIEQLKKQLETKEEKLKNQAIELNHLTNNIVPNLKKENKKLKALKVELTDALEKSTKKYFDQLEINADLSESVTKKGAGLQLAKVRINEIEKLVAKLEAEGIGKKESSTEKEASTTPVSGENAGKINELNKKIKDLEKQLKNKDKEIDKKSSQVKEKNSEINDLKENLIPKLKSESANLTKELKNTKAELGEAESKVRGQIVKLEANIKDLEEKLDNKTRDYNKLSTNLNNKDKEIKSLKNKNKELSDIMNEQSNKGFFSKLTRR